MRLTAFAFVAEGTTQKRVPAEVRVGIVNVIAWVGTAAISGKQPS